MFFFLNVDWSGRCTISCGTSGTGETPQAKPRRLNARPAESCTWNENQHLFVKPEVKKAESLFEVSDSAF
ncbi:hypothetical protein FZC78_04185 [Rossellomorea vietnamensis]|uniref:Uncharacterized protein n=1 Tax=Rossellomorea vietnamensis TaxID=218284 RepID=A0A5D4NXV2_9BACI|nr:hypothetical protein FZC78_04185 [Rossellomorea vietnamensis]